MRGTTLLSPKPNFKSVLFSLLPYGEAYQEYDEALQSILEAFSKEFTRYFDWVGNISNSIPDGELKNGPSDDRLDDRWEKILGTKNFPAKLAERGIYKHEQLVTNTTEHFLELAKHQGFTPEWKKDSPYNFLFVGIPFRGMDHRESTPEAKAFVRSLLQLKHAHLWISVKKDK